MQTRKLVKEVPFLYIFSSKRTVTPNQALKKPFLNHFFKIQYLPCSHVSLTFLKGEIGDVLNKMMVVTSPHTQRRAMRLVS